MNLCGALLVLATGAASGRCLNGQTSDTLCEVRILLLGDVNLGRSVGQDLLHGKSERPFDRVKEVFSESDIVFANLESPISDQKGETEDPRSNTVFCAPPIAAEVLRKARITIVSTANNHAYDYGMRGLRETRRYLDRAGVTAVGTTEYQDSLWSPAVVGRQGLRVGVVACTQFINIAGPWTPYIALFDREKLKEEIGRMRERVDFVIASYHGGREYADSLDEELLSNLRFLVDAGADLVVAHHSHVPGGIIVYKQKLIFMSLGNFVFIQPQRQWTQRSFGVQLRVCKRNGGVVVREILLRPVRASGQPSFSSSRSERRSLLERLRRLSNVPLIEEGDFVRVQLQGLASSE